MMLVVLKSLFKSSAIAGGSTKARMVQALVATRKRTVSKTAPRHGEGAKQQEEKGPSNPKPNLKDKDDRIAALEQKMADQEAG
uniref:Uncharacterized protein n=1 Tax=Brassica oleracea var. oleracea TaxID=109376 RepID=A0A0D3AVC0_BRAOL